MKPRVYLASKLHRAADWRLFKSMYSTAIDVVSTWHDNLTVEIDENFDEACRLGWEANWWQVVQEADALIAHGEAKDALNGTMIEIGMAYAKSIPIFLVGSYPWGTWKILPHVRQVDSVAEAVDRIVQGVKP